MDAAASPSAAKRKELTGWRAKLPKVPDPVRVDLPGLNPQTAFLIWVTLSVVMLVGGVWLNHHLTDGAWVLPEQSLENPQNPFGSTEVQFLTSHPYDLVTATLFVGATLLLGLSLLAHREGWTRHAAVASLGIFLTLLGLDIVAGATAGVSAIDYGLGGVVGTLLGTTALASGLAVVGVWWANRHASETTVGAIRHGLRAAGWIVFALHWATTALMFFHVEGEDYVNAGFALAAVPLLNYFAYQEYISLRQGQDNASLRFAAGSVFIAATVWYVFLRIEPLSEWIIELVAAHTLAFLQLLGQDVVIGPDGRTGFVSAITYAEQFGGIRRTVIIILACTAIQSMMIFVAAALAVQKAPWQRRMAVIGVTVPLVYGLNLVRNVLIIFLWETRYLERNFGVSDAVSFGIAHNWIGKVGSLIALVFIALFMFRVLPEVVHAVVGLLDLPRRRGPLERYILTLRGKDDDTRPPGGSVEAPTAAKGDMVGGEA